MEHFIEEAQNGYLFRHRNGIDTFVFDNKADLIAKIEEVIE